MYLIHFISFWIWNSLPWILPSRKYWTLISVFTICRSLLAARDAWMTAVNRMSVWTIFARGFLIWRPEVKCRFETAPNRMTTPTCPDFTEVIHHTWLDSVESPFWIVGHFLIFKMVSDFFLKMESKFLAARSNSGTLRPRAPSGPSPAACPRPRSLWS